MKHLRYCMCLLMMLIISTVSIFAETVPVTVAIDGKSANVENIAKTLSSRLNTALKSAGIHSEGEAGLYLIAELLPVSKETVEAGMRNIDIINYELTLKLEQPFLNHSFGQIAIPLKGSGYDANKAAMDAIQKLNGSSKNIKDFIQSSVAEATDYYITHADMIVDKARLLARSGNYDEAITLLWSCPNLEAIHSKVMVALEQTFIAKQNLECESLLKKAENAFALKQYDLMKEYLDQIDPLSRCGTQAKALANKAGTELRRLDKEAIDREERAAEREFKAHENERNRQYNLEKHRASAIAEVAKAYARSTWQTRNYYIIR